MSETKRKTNETRAPAIIPIITMMMIIVMVMMYKTMMMSMLILEMRFVITKKQKMMMIKIITIIMMMMAICLHTNATRMLIGVVGANTYKSHAFALLFV